MLVRFLASWQSNAGHYMSGDVAEVSADVAATVLKSKVARELTLEERDRLVRRTVRVGATAIVAKEPAPPPASAPPAHDVAAVTGSERAPASFPAPGPTSPPSSGRSRRGR